MDTEYDFITPELFHVVFFEQKNIVIFPYVDLKHLHALEIFTAGYSFSELDGTSFQNIELLTDFTKTNQYSQTPNIFLLYNLSKKRIQEVLEMPELRCILNSPDDIGDLANGQAYIFYNKKQKKFLNYDFQPSDLEFEEYLLSISATKEELMDNIQRVKSIATLIYTSVSQNEAPERVFQAIQDFKQEYWGRILQFTEKFHQINIPKGFTEKLISLAEKNSLPSPKEANKEANKEESKESNQEAFFKEYQYLMQNQRIGSYFIQALHDFRIQHVNNSNLSLDQIANPKKLYAYLRSNHWNQGIPESFFEEIFTNNKLDSKDIEDILKILNIFQVKSSSIDHIIEKLKQNNETAKADSKGRISDKVPHIKDFKEFSLYFTDLREDCEILINRILKKLRK